MVDFGHNVFEGFGVEKIERESKSLIDGYIQRSLTMETLSLIDVARSWTYNPRRKNEIKWNARKNAAIVRAWPRFNTVPEKHSKKIVDFCWSELLLYKPFRNIERDIGVDDSIIIVNWEVLNYRPWHIERRIDVNNMEQEHQNDLEDDDERIVQQNTIENEWEIIAQLHRRNHFARIEIDMLGRRDVDIQAQWDNEYRGEEYINKAIH